ncbi:MAG: hypothetical protein D6696_06100 [Acidobacteria bacterium]|nr:MAG: hypothetical protein D6696_06100 [Acidobacteriota bacterium]
MSPERWRRAEAIFGAAVERPPAERPAFVERACGEDPHLRRQVDELLAADGEAGGFLSQPVIEELKSPGGGDHPAGLGGAATLGPYRLVRKLGEGGMSTVYLAVRADRELRRRVALKCLRTTAAGAEERRRLERERQILASLDHPSIARLYDAGTTAGGLPYFVMEYIEGEAITAYCDRHRLSIGERLDLFRQVCAAVRYAHQNLIVHRDIKPSNILVGASGTPKLLDFGIAKWLNPELTSSQLLMTVPWRRFLTPEYASPEQIQGQPVTTTSDVYSLGVLLFELLAGSRPFRFDPAAPREIERRILEEEPPLASAALAVHPEREAIARARRSEPQKLRRQLAGDLDLIVAKALRKEPRRRYGSAEELAEDLRRYQSGLPVTARKPTFLYRSARFLARNRLAVAVAVAFVTLLTAAAAGLGWLSLQLTRQRDQAIAERQHARTLAKFFQGILEYTNPQLASGAMIPARELVDRAAAELRHLDDDPEVQAEVMNSLGRTYYSLGLYRESVAMHEAALARRQTIYGSGHLAVSSSLLNLGMARLGMGDLAGAEAAMRRTIVIRRAIFPGDHVTTAAALRALAVVLAVRGPADEAEAVANEALAMFRRLRDEEHADVTNTLYDLGNALYLRGKLDQAEATYRRSLERRRASLGPGHLLIATNLLRLGNVLIDLDDLEGAERALTEARAIMSARLARDHLFRLRLDIVLARLDLARGDAASARDLLERDLELARSRLGSDHYIVAKLMLTLGRAHLVLGTPEAAAEPLERALAIYRQVLHHGDARTTSALVALGRCQLELGRLDEARATLRKAQELLLSKEPPRADLLDEVRKALGRVPGSGEGIRSTSMSSSGHDSRVT